MEQFYPTLKKDFWRIIQFSNDHYYIVIECLKCGSRWEILKEKAREQEGILTFLNHEYRHRNKS